MSYQRDWQVSFEALRNSDRPCSRPPTPMRSGKCLVQVNMDDIEAHVPGPDLSKNWVEVGPIIVEQSPRLVNSLRDFENVFLEYSESVGVGYHQTGGLGTYCSLQRGQVDHSVCVGWHDYHPEACHGCACRVCTVGGVRH